MHYRLLSLIGKYGEQFTPSIKLGYIRLLRSITGINLGLTYIRSNPITWQYPIKLCSVEHTMYVIREAHELIFYILTKYSTMVKDEQFILEMLEEILQPIQKNTFRDSSPMDEGETSLKDEGEPSSNNGNIDQNTMKWNLNEMNTLNKFKPIMIKVDDIEILSVISSTLDLLSYIFEQSLTNAKDSQVTITLLCSSKFNLQISVWKLVEMTQNRIFLSKILRTLTALNFARLICEETLEDDKIVIEPEKFNHFGLNFFNTMKFCVNRKELWNFLQLAELNHILWKRITERVPKMIKIDEENVSFENQLITFHLLPILFMLHSKNFCGQEIFDQYIMKLFEINSDHTLRICYSFRDILMDSSSCDSTQQSIDMTKFADLAYKSINGILAMEKILDREQAILVFQAMIYALKTFIDGTMTVVDHHTKRETKHYNSDNGISSNSELIIISPNVFYSILIGLRSLIERYHITWTESLETICLVKMVVNILKNTNLTDKVSM